jgi:hypothetical protein
MGNNADRILIFTGGDVSPEVRRGLGSALKNAAAQASEVAVSTLQENLRRFLSSLDTILSNSPKEVGGLALDEVEIHVQIDSKGNVGISALAGAEVAA